MDTLVDVGSINDFPPGAQRTVLVGNTRILLCRDPVGNDIHALEDRCGHAFQPLQGGVVWNGAIQCPKHGACFDLTTGQPLNAVTHRSVKAYEVVVQGDRILLSTSAKRPLTR